MFRVGHGYDVHKLVKNCPLILGGVRIPSDLGLLGHSDADVLLHAIMDSLLGAAALGDIGKFFPDTDDKYRDANSCMLLEQVNDFLINKNYKIENIDATIVAQGPKLATYLQEMRKNIARCCGLNVDQVSVKATTEEKLGFTGKMEGIASHAVCLISK